MAEKKNENLIRELYKEMEEELEKGPEAMDTYKIKYINLLIAKLEGREELPPDMEPEQFLGRFNEKFGLDLSLKTDDLETPAVGRQKIKRVSRKGRMAVAAVVIAVLAGIGNMASVMAMDKSLWQVINETTHNVYFRTLEPEKGVLEESLNNGYETYPDWESLGESIELKLLIPEYVPDGLALEGIDKNAFENRIEIAAYYQGTDEQLIFLCEYYAAEGDFLKYKGGREAVGQQKEIGGRNVHISMEEGINIIFAEDGIIYTIDTNLDLEEVEKVIENIKRI